MNLDTPWTSQVSQGMSSTGQGIGPSGDGGGDTRTSRLGRDSMESTGTAPTLSDISRDDIASRDSSWNWNQAQTADGRTYYFNEKKEVKWTLTLEEKMKMLQTLELR